MLNSKMRMMVIKICILISMKHMTYPMIFAYHQDKPAGEPLVLNEMQDYEYRTMVQKLNKEQKEFFTHTLQLIKTSDKLFYSFLSGGWKS